jgi:hypothetical protein
VTRTIESRVTGTPTFRNATNPIGLPVRALERLAGDEQHRGGAGERDRRGPGVHEALWAIPGSIAALAACYAYGVRREEREGR